MLFRSTLIEIMIVIAILGGLIAVLGTQVLGARDKANVKQINSTCVSCQAITTKRICIDKTLILYQT